MKYKFDEVYVKENTAYIRGWVTPNERANHVNIIVRNQEKKKIRTEIFRIERADVGKFVFDDARCDHYGFVLVFPLGRNDEFYITFREYESGNDNAVNSMTLRVSRSLLAIKSYINYVRHHNTAYCTTEIGKEKAEEKDLQNFNGKNKKVRYRFDEVKMSDGMFTLRGWAVPNNKMDNIIFQLYDEKKCLMEVSTTQVKRPDVGLFVFEDRNADNFGFILQFSMEKNKIFYLQIIEADKDGKEKNRYTVPLNRKDLARRARWEYSSIFKTYTYLKTNGVRRTVTKIVRKVLRMDMVNYQRWFERNKPGKAELAHQRQVKFSYRPKMSIIVPVYNTPLNFLNEMIQSVQQQTYSNWELCLANGSGNNKELNAVLKQYADADARIKFVVLEENKGISGNTNEALKLATGDFIALLDHDDLLAPNAMFECVKVLNRNPEVDVLYSDEDKVDMDGKRHFEPNFKPDFNIDLLCSVNYICHLFVVKKTLVDQFGGFTSKYDGAQDYDFIFRSIELSNKIYHIPKVLYHWRAHMDSTAENPESKLYAFKAGVTAIEDHYKRVGINGTVEMGPYYGMYRSHFKLPYHPLVSVIIPNKDHTDDLDKCIQSLMRTTYDNFEIIVVENNSDQKKTFDYYKKIEKENEKVTVVYWEHEFNYSAINNFGVSYANGEYLLLLNNDTEVINEDVFEEMLGYAMREDVGIVGARLYYEDDTVQHAGVIVGIGGVAGHVFAGAQANEPCYMGRSLCAQDYSAVTAACLMVRKEIFEEVDGLTEEFAVAFNDIDFCLKVSKLGKLVVYNPAAELHHYESKSRGYEDTEEKIQRFNGEIQKFQKRWKKFLLEGDPYYNPNLSLNCNNFSVDMTKGGIFGRKG